MVLKEIGVWWEGGKVGEERKPGKLGWTKGRLAREPQSAMVAWVWPMYGRAHDFLLTGRVCHRQTGDHACHTFVRQNYKQAALHQSWHFCLRANCCHFSPNLFSWPRFWTSQLGLLFSEQWLWVAISGNSSVPRKAGFLPIPGLIEITCHSLLPLIQRSVFNWTIDLESYFVCKIIQLERHSKKSWRLQVLESYKTHIPLLIMQ